MATKCVNVPILVLQAVMFDGEQFLIPDAKHEMIHDPRGQSEGEEVFAMTPLLIVIAHATVVLGRAGLVIRAVRHG